MRRPGRGCVRGGSARPRDGTSDRRRGLAPTEEPALERLQQLLARKRADVLRSPIAVRDVEIVGQRAVGLLQRVIELVALEDVVLRAAAPRRELGVDTPADR